MNHVVGAIPTNDLYCTDDKGSSNAT